MDASPVTGNSTIDGLLAIAGAVVPLLSAFAGFFNARIRAATAAGEPVAPGVLKAVAGLNVLAVNIDKAKQLVTLAREGMGVAPKAQPGEPCPACGRVVPVAELKAE